MSGKIKAAMVIGVLVAAGGGGAFYHFNKQAGEDTRRITTLEVKEQTRDGIIETLSGSESNFDEANMALKATASLEEEQQVELLTQQMEHDNATVRLSAYQELFRLHRAGNSKAGALLEARASSEKERENLLAIQVHLAGLSLDHVGDEPGARLAAIRAMAGDPRPGYRMAAVGQLAEMDDVAARSLLEALSEDPDEDVSMTAELFLEGDEGDDYE